MPAPPRARPPQRTLFAIDPERIREVLSDLVDALDDLGFNVPKDKFEDRDGNMQVFLRGISRRSPMQCWTELMTSLDELKAGCNHPKASTYVEMARDELVDCCTWEEP